MCKHVHKYVYVLWSLVITGIAVLLYSVLAASVRVVSDAAPTDPVSTPNIDAGRLICRLVPNIKMSILSS